MEQTNSSINSKSRLDRLREKKRLQQLLYKPINEEETDGEGADTTMPIHSITPATSKDNGEVAPAPKSALHALFCDAADDWILSQKSITSDESSISKRNGSSYRSAPVTRDVPSFDATEASDSGDDTTVPTAAPPRSYEDLKQPMVKNNGLMSAPKEQKEEAQDKKPPTQIYKSTESVVSLDSSDNDSYGYDTLKSEGSVMSMEQNNSSASFNGSTADSIDDSIHSEIGSLDQLFERIQQQKRRSSWSTYKSLSSSSNFSADDLRDVFIKDDKYSWVPAKVLEYQKEYAIVAIDAPSNWVDATVLEEEIFISPTELHPSMTDVLQSDIARLVTDNDIPRCQLRKVLYKQYELEELPLQNPPGKGKRDMADLIELHPASILYNLKERHFEQKPYTRVGDIIIAMNPFTWIDGLYTTETRDMYSSNLIWESNENSLNGSSNFSRRKSVYDDLGYDPHVYETSALAYRDLATTRQDQTILVTGESGAGKTETVKIVMNHLATVQETRPGGVPSEHSSAKEIVARVCKSSPVFEAFGNAKTVRNDNSSRFGKFIQLIFELESKASAKDGGRDIPFTDLIGSNCVTYLLEKNRVVSHADGERTFHIFYQLLAAPKKFKETLWDYFGDVSTSDFSFTAGIESSAADESTWNETKAALELFKFQGKELKVLMQALAIVLQLGNLRFGDDVISTEDAATIKNRDDLDLLADMSGIDAQSLEKVLTSRTFRTRGQEDIQVALSPQAAKECCDALAKEIYSKIFDLMVRRVNEYTSFRGSIKKNGQTYGRISLLDIFGFERFFVNRFEQLCINYANERLHNKYVLDNFNAVKDEYEAEGVDLYDFRLVDNTHILDLLEGKSGIISSLNEECLRPQGNPESFVYKLKVTHKNEKTLIDRKLHRKFEFGINHFTGPVEYDANNFVERNMDKLPDDVIKCAVQTTNTIIRNEFKIYLTERDSDDGGNSSTNKSKPGKQTVLGKFQLQLKSLLKAIDGTRTRYIRCIKPNPDMIPRKTSQKTTMLQLECSGIMTALIMSRESFPNKQTYDFLISRYNCLMNERDTPELTGMEPKEKISYILSQLLKPLARKGRGGTRTLPYACGKTKVFFKAGAQDKLEELRTDILEKCTVALQAWARKVSALAVFKDKKNKATIIQAWVRMIPVRESFCDMKIKTCKIQSLARMVAAMRKFACARKNAIVIQAWARKNAAVRSFTEKKENARKIQAWARKNAAVRSFTEKKEGARKIQAWARKISALLRFNNMKHKACVIQAYARRAIAAQDYRNKKMMASKIQALVRMVIAFVAYSDKKCKACTIQAFARKVAAVDLYAKSRRSAITIQSFARKVAAIEDYKHKRNKICKIQTWWRTVAAVVAFTSLRVKTCTIQSFIRMSNARADFWTKRESATMITAWIRGRWCVELLQSMREDKYATVIQSAVRTWLARLQYKRTKSAVKIIQNASRRYQKRVALQAQLRALEIKEETLQRSDPIERALPIDPSPEESSSTEAQSKENAVRAPSASDAKEKTDRSTLADKSRAFAARQKSAKLRSIFSSKSTSPRGNRQSTQRNVSEAEENLRAELEALKAQNKKLEEKLEATEAQRDDLAAREKKMTDETLVALGSRMRELTETNDAVIKEAFKYRAELKKIKRQQKSHEIQASARISVLEEELENATKLHEKEKKALTDTLKENEKNFEEERLGFREEIESLKQKYAKDTKALADELRKTHQSHQDYLTELMDTLEKTHVMRVQETEQISKELETVRAVKDREIRVLKQEVRLLCARKAGLNTVRSILEVGPIKDDLNEEAESRARRSAQFDDAVQTLNSLVAKTCTLPSDAEDYDMKQISEKQERAQKMSELIDTLNVIYRIEEDSRANANQVALDIIEEYVAVTEPQRTIVELRERLAAQEFACSKLREELKDKEVCKRCEIRNEAARRRIQRAEAR